MTAQSLSQSVLAGQHVLITGGAGSGKTHTLGQLVNDLVPAHYYPRHVAAHAVTRGSVAGLQAAVTPLVEVGTVHHAAWSATGNRDIIRGTRRDLIWQRRSFVSRYLDLLCQVGHVGDTRADRHYLRTARSHVGAALRLEARARMAGDNVLDQWAQTPGQLAPGFVAEVAERYHDYKESNRLYDATDLHISASPDPNVRLVVVDDAEDLSRADLEFLARVYPEAAFVFAGNPELPTRTWEDLVPLRSIPHTVAIELTDSHRVNETWTIDSATAYAGLIPPDVSANQDLLIILGARSRIAFKRWVGWCMDAGHALRIDDARVLDKMPVRDIAAFWRCDQGDEVHPARLDRLARAVGEPEGVNTCASDFPGWTNWREMAQRAGYPQGAIDYAEALLLRYGTLDLTEIASRPLPRITSVARCKGLTADVVIVDGFSMGPQHGDGEDSARLRWTLACSRARRLLIVLQSETNMKLRQPTAQPIF